MALAHLGVHAILKVGHKLPRLCRACRPLKFGLAHIARRAVLQPRLSTKTLVSEAKRGEAKRGACVPALGSRRGVRLQVMCAYVHVCACVYLHMYIYRCMCIYVYICVCAYR